jgi:hypothetical protein
MYRITLLVDEIPDHITPDLLVQEHTLLAVRTIAGEEIFGRVVSVDCQAHPPTHPPLGAGER